MYKRIGEYEFVDMFRQLDREENFSREGRFAFYDYLTDLEEQLDEEYKLDVIGLCCEYNEYKSFEEYQEDYDNDYEDLDELEADYTVIRVGDEGFIVQVH